MGKINQELYVTILCTCRLQLSDNRYNSLCQNAVMHGSQFSKTHIHSWLSLRFL